LIAVFGVGEKGEIARFGREQASALLDDDISIAMKFGVKVARECCECHTHFRCRSLVRLWM
jgi:hypothetical protein